MDFDEKINEVVVDYHVISKPESLTQEELKGQLFEQLYQNIINDILREAIEIHKNEQ